MRTSSVRAVVFDMDGTLVDSLPVDLACYRRVVLELDGPDLAIEEVLSSFSIGSASRMLEALIRAARVWRAGRCRRLGRSI